MRPDRQWMDYRLIDGYLNPDFVEGVASFIQFACSQPEFMDGDKIRCPCKKAKCRNRSYQTVNDVHNHLLRVGFVSGYYTWTLHGEREFENPTNNTFHDVHFGYDATAESSNACERMVFDVAGPDFPPNVMDESPNPEAQRIFEMLNAANQELWSGCQTHTQMSAVSRMLNIKSEHHLSERCYDDLCQLMKEMMPTDNVMTESFYSTKKLVRGMGLPVEKIHCCYNGCMIYWGADSELTYCKFCDHPRYKSSGQKANVPFKKMYYFPLTPRLQRLYASNATAKEMRWHAEHEIQEDGRMCHPSDALAWKYFNQTHPEFAFENRNVRLGLCTDGFQPFGQSGQQYSSWPVILTPYNLPPWMCMKEEYMFLTVIVPGPNNPKQKLDVYLQPLIAELIQLWEVGVQTYDVENKENFILRAALLWTISDFPAYSMLSGWTTSGKLACPYCMRETDAFTLDNGGKQSWFDNHRKFLPMDHEFRTNKISFMKNKTVSKVAPTIKSGNEILAEIDAFGLMKVTELGAEENNRPLSKKCGWKKRSIFWDLPYWRTNLIRHNLDVMHIEKNVFENVFNTVMNVQGKTKDNAKSREDLKLYCRRPELAKDEATGKYPKAFYTLDKKSRQKLCEWVKDLKFPDGYCSNMARCVDMRKHKLFGMKSHDCHVFMQRLIPIAFQELLPENVWEALTELSLFFKDLTSTTIREEDMRRLHQEIPIILCKLERIFPPSFFDSMEHLPVHLAYEAMIAGPVQYRWMYPFERYLGKLKKNVRNKASVEGSICNAYLVEEASFFCSHYFDPHVNTKYRRVPRNDDDDGNLNQELEGNLSIFKCPGRSFGVEKTRFLTDEEYHAAHTYILLNCPEVNPFISIFMSQLRLFQPNITDQEIDGKLEVEFAHWFNLYAHGPYSNITNKFLQDLAKGPLRKVRSYPAYYVNGFKFHTVQYGSNKRTMNSGVCVKGSNYSADESDYYGQLIEVISVEYPALPIKRTVLFKCEWFNATQNVGVKVHKKYNIVQVNHTKRLNKYEPFVLAIQAQQVHFLSYPSTRRDKRDWWAVCKIKARHVVDIPESSRKEDVPYQDEETGFHEINIEQDTEHLPLNDPSGSLIEIDDEELDEEDEREPLLDSDDENIDLDDDF